MKSLQLETSNPLISLIEPTVERDAELSVSWLNGQMGRETLKLMGVTDAKNVETTLEQEKERIKKFISSENQINWMINYDHKVIGSIWVDLESSEYLKAPSVHIMIGAQEARGKGIGSAATEAVLDFLKQNSFLTAYSRHLSSNVTAGKLLADKGFSSDGEPYSDTDGLVWQNVQKSLVGQS